MRRKSEVSDTLSDVGMSAVPYANPQHAGLAHLPKPPGGGRAAVHPILVGLMERHDQRKGWIAQR